MLQRWCGSVRRRGARAPTILLGIALLGVLPLAGCATAYTQGLALARQGRYAEASALYEQVLTRDPDRLDALVQLGIARYKLGALDEAVSVLERALARAPREMAGRLYLAQSPRTSRGRSLPRVRHPRSTPRARIRAMGSRVSGR